MPSQQTRKTEKRFSNGNPKTMKNPKTPIQPPPILTYNQKNAIWTREVGKKNKK
jgi:hypothetical protein